MSRSLKKGPFYDNNLLKKVNNILLNNKKKIIKTWSRRSVIIPEFLGFTVLVHNGKTHTPVYITENMIGYKLGEFSITKNLKKYSKLKVNKIINKKK